MTDLVGHSLGLFNFLVTILARILAEKLPLAQFKDPFQLIGPVEDPNNPAAKLIPVLVPLRNADATIQDEQVIVTANVAP